MPQRSFHEYPVAASLRGLLASYWCFRAEPRAAAGRHAVIPDGCISLVFTRAPARRPPVVLGPRATVLHVPVEPGACILGARLQPWAGAALLGVAPRELRDGVPPLDVLAPALAAALAPALASPRAEPLAELEAVLVELAGSLPAPDPGVAEAVRAVDAARVLLTVAAAAARAHIGERQFQRRFLRAVGLTFKEYARIRRFRAAALELLVDETPLARLAAARGYADQSHLVRESARLAGVSPRALRHYLAAIQHSLLVS